MIQLKIGKFISTSGVIGRHWRLQNIKKGQKEVNQLKFGKFTYGCNFIITDTHLIPLSVIEHIISTSGVIRGHWRLQNIRIGQIWEI